MWQVLRIDLADWRAGGERAAAVIDALDESLQRSGFVLVTGHRVPSEFAATLRAAARQFFRLDTWRKEPYAVTAPGDRGWRPLGTHAVGRVDDADAHADLKESLVFGSSARGEADAGRARPGWSAVHADLGGLVERYAAAMRALADELLELFAVALCQPPAVLLGGSADAAWTLTVDHFLPRAATGPARPGQFRVGPHTDAGAVTILDEEQTAAGVEVLVDERRWVEAPHDPEALTVNVGDLIELWTSGRWVAGRHRVPPPEPAVADDDPVSLVYFCNLHDSTRLTPLRRPIGRGRGTGSPVVCGDYVRSKLAPTTIG